VSITTLAMSVSGTVTTGSEPRLSPSTRSSTELVPGVD